MANTVGWVGYYSHPLRERINKLMGLFLRKPNPLAFRAQELGSKIEQIDKQISQLQDASEEANPALIRPPINKSTQILDDPILGTKGNLKNGARTILKPDFPGLYNDQRMRKFDLHGWWQRTKGGEPLPEPSQNEKLVTYLATGRNHGYTALRKETRVARNRFILLTLVLITILWSILSLLIPQL